MYHQNMLFSEFLRTDEKRSAVTTEEALCQLYKTLYVHQESPGFSKLTSLLQVSLALLYGIMLRYNINDSLDSLHLFACC